MFQNTEYYGRYFDNNMLFILCGTVNSKSLFYYEFEADFIRDIYHNIDSKKYIFNNR